MSKENIKRLQEELQTNAELKVKLEALKLSHENLEGLVDFAKEAGFDFTLEELKESNLKPAVEELSIDELEKVVGGITDGDGNWITTVAFSCGGWQASPDTWYAVEGQCGSCKYWDFVGPVKEMCYLGFPGTCRYPY